MANSSTTDSTSDSPELKTLMDTCNGVAPMAHRWILLLLTAWVFLILPMPNWMDAITNERRKIWTDSTKLRVQLVTVRKNYLLANLSKNIDDKKIQNIVTEVVFKHKNTTNSKGKGAKNTKAMSVLPKSAPFGNSLKNQSWAKRPVAPIIRHPVKSNAPNVLRISSYSSAEADQKEEAERQWRKYVASEKKRRCAELIKNAAQEEPVRELLKEPTHNRIYQSLLSDPVGLGTTLIRFRKDHAPIDNSIKALKVDYDKAQKDNKDAKHKLAGQKPSFDVTIPSFLALPLPGSISAPFVLCLWCLAATALAIYLQEKRRVAIALCQKVMEQNPTLEGVALHQYWWWFARPFPEPESQKIIEGFLGWREQNTVLLRMQMAFLLALVSAHAYVLLVAIRFREWAAYFMSIPPSGNYIGSSASFGSVPGLALLSLVVVVSLIMAWWIIPPMSTSAAPPVSGRREFIQLALLTPAAGALCWGLHKKFWTQVDYETLRRWWRRPRFRNRVNYQAVHWFQPGFYVSRRKVERQGDRNWNAPALIVHFVWDTEQFNDRLTMRLKDNRADSINKRWPADHTWSIKPFAAEGEIVAEPGQQSMAFERPRFRKKARPAPQPLKGCVIRHVNQIKTERLIPVEIDMVSSSLSFRDPERGSDPQNSVTVEGFFRIHTRTSAHAMEQYALTCLIQGQPQRCIAWLQRAIEMDSTYKSKIRRPISIRLCDLLVGVALRYSNTMVEDTFRWLSDVYQFHQPDDVQKNQIEARMVTWKNHEWHRRWRNRKNAIRWGGIMLPPVSPDQVVDTPLPGFNPAPEASVER